MPINKILQLSMQFLHPKPSFNFSTSTSLLTSDTIEISACNTPCSLLPSNLLLFLLSFSIERTFQNNSSSGSDYPLQINYTSRACYAQAIQFLVLWDPSCANLLDIQLHSEETKHIWQVPRSFPSEVIR